jgi:hypothetical protein
MIESVTIKGYRAFPSFSMENLGRVNLLVGKNNTGKTSILEAVYLLAAQGEPNALWRILARRGEQIPSDPTVTRSQQPELDIRHLFHGHDLLVDSCASITTTNQSPARALSFTVVEAKRKGFEALWAQMPVEAESIGVPRLSLDIAGKPSPVAPMIPLSVRGGIRPEMVPILNNMAINAKKTDVVIPQFITSESVAWNELVALWPLLFSLEPGEKHVISALKILEPRIEGINLSGQLQYGIVGMRAGFKVRLEGDKNTVPIGSLGEGTWRMLALAMMLWRAKGNILLVDEIDSGLHHTVMADMWKMIIATARELDVQVFATTHSYDCVYSLANVCPDASKDEKIVSIHRIEAAHKESIPFTDEQLRIAAARKLEIR